MKRRSVGIRAEAAQEGREGMLRMHRHRAFMPPGQPRSGRNHCMLRNLKRKEFLSHFFHDIDCESTNQKQSGQGTGLLLFQ